MIVYVSSEERKRNAKYIVPFVIVLFVICLVGQLLGQLFNVSQLNKTSGKIMALRTIVGSPKRHSGSQNFDLAITLDNRQPFYVEDTETVQRLDSTLHTGDMVTIYTPTLMYKIVCSGFVHAVSQIELDNRVIYSFAEQKKEAWLLIGFFAIAAGIFWGLRIFWLNGS